MKHAVELFFDAKTEQKLFSLAGGVAEAGLSTKYLEWKTRPHMTLACFNDADEADCVERLRAFARTHACLPAHIGSVGAFVDTKTIFASPVMTEDMYRFQRELHACMRGFDTRGWEWYLPNRWVPHCALALTAEDPEDAFYRACDLILHRFEKLSGQFAEIGLVRITFPVQQVFSARLCRP